MLQTLFHIPPDWFGLPGMIVWLLLCSLWLAVVAVRDRESLKTEFWATLPIIVIGSMAFLFLFPKLGQVGVDPDNPLGDPVNRGLAIRGYGVMLMLGVLAGVGITFCRCRRIGYPTDYIFRLAIWMIVCGMIGARLFFVIQNRDQFFLPNASLWETGQRVFDMVGGGLVVFGSLIGALVAAIFVVFRFRLPVWLTADLIAPGMALGLAIGRIGCLLNGCCWGGICDASLPAISFPAGSPPYSQHLQTGQLLGIKTESLTNELFNFRVLDVRDGLGKKLGLTNGEKFGIYYDGLSVAALEAEQLRYLVGKPAAESVLIDVVGDRIGEVKVPLSDLPVRSRAIHPTQIYSSINAFVLCLFLWFYWHVRRNDGEVMALMLIMYPISRFVLELIRNDEVGQFGTDLTISQCVSLVTVACGIGLFAWIRMFGKRDNVPKMAQPAIREVLP